MTLAQRNLYFKAGILLSACSLFLLTALAAKLAPFLAEYCAAAVSRPEGLVQRFAGGFAPVPLVPLLALFGSVLYALLVSIAVLVYFEKTQTPELLFFCLFALSFMVEILRIMVPLKGIIELSPVFLILGTRLLVFARIFGTLCLFTSGVYASGLDMQKQGRVIFAIIIAVLVISLRVPVNGFAWDTSFTMLFAYSNMFRYAELIITIMTGASFLVAAYTKGTSAYRYIAFGSVLVFLGRALLFASDTWLGPAPAIIMLAAGTWLIITRLHKIYLWL